MLTNFLSNFNPTQTKAEINALTCKTHQMLHTKCKPYTLILAAIKN